MRQPNSDPLDKAIDQIIDHHVGVYKNAWQVVDPESGTSFATWLEVNVTMAKKYKGITAFQLHLLSVAKKPDGHVLLDQRTIASFTQTTYPQQRAEILEVFHRASELGGTTDVACILINLGDALQVALN